MFISTADYRTPVALVADQTVKVENVLEQGTGDMMEDVLLIQDSLFGVFDGATSLDGWTTSNGTTGGLKAATIAAESFARNDACLVTLAEQANRRIRREYHAQGIQVEERHRLWSTSLAVVRLEDDTFTWCRTGDAMIVVVDQNGGYRLVTPEVDLDLETLTMWKNVENPAGLSIREVLGDQIIKVREGMNRNYGVLNGEPEAVKFLDHGRESLDGVAAILLFTDGLFLPMADPSAGHDWCNFVEMYKQGGLQNIHSHIRNLQQIDPECCLYPRFKKHDDIAAIALELPR